MKADTKNSLHQCLEIAVSSCTPELNEEEGGFLLNKVGTKQFEFCKVRNANTGTTTARSLFTADKREYGEKVIGRILDGKWQEYASFHTHPAGFGPFPSQTDIRLLFEGFPVNYIYSHDRRMLMQYTANIQKKIWQPKQIRLVK